MLSTYRLDNSTSSKIEKFDFSWGGDNSSLPSGWKVRYREEGTVKKNDFLILFFSFFRKVLAGGRCHLDPPVFGWGGKAPPDLQWKTPPLPCFVLSVRLLWWHVPAQRLTTTTAGTRHQYVQSQRVFQFPISEHYFQVIIIGFDVHFNLLQIHANS